MEMSGIREFHPHGLAHPISEGPVGNATTPSVSCRGCGAADSGHPATAADLAARCHRAALEGRWATTMRFYAGPRMLIIDEVAYMPLPAEAAATLFQVVSQRYLKGSIALTTNLGIASWGKVFNDDPMIAGVLLDRLLHRSVGAQHRRRQLQDAQPRGPGRGNTTGGGRR